MSQIKIPVLTQKFSDRVPCTFCQCTHCGHIQEVPTALILDTRCFQCIQTTLVPWDTMKKLETYEEVNHIEASLKSLRTIYRTLYIKYQSTALGVHFQQRLACVNFLLGNVGLQKPEANK